MDTPKHLRPIYEQLGADYYYRTYADAYQNPHKPQIQQLLQQNRQRIAAQNALDFCAGGGEVSEILLAWQVPQLTASDPYTHRLYQKKIGRPCLQWSFRDVLKGKMTGEFSTIISSFALHLCEEEQLHGLVSQLFAHAPQLIVISPHKRPALDEYEGIRLDFEDFALTEKGKKVFLRAYSCTW